MREHRKPKSILLVDDEPIILKSLSRELGSGAHNFDVALAASAEEAIAKIRNHSFDLVMTDLVMPGLDGLQVLKASKQKDAQTMVIIMTGYADLESAIEALRLGADDFLEKPYDTETLLSRMATCFVKQNLQRKTARDEEVLPICSYCRKIRPGRQDKYSNEPWYSLEEYFNTVKRINISHGCCPDCFTTQMLDDFPEASGPTDLQKQG